MANTDVDSMRDQTILISELLIKLSTLENILLNKNIITKDEIAEEAKNVVAKLTKIVQTTVANQIKTEMEKKDSK